MVKVNEKKGKRILVIEDADEKKEEGESEGSGKYLASQEIAAERNGDHIEAALTKAELAKKGEHNKKALEFDSGFGWVELHGKRYDFDIIVHVDGSITKRENGLSKKKKEKYGHTPLTSKELKELVREAPAMIIIGTGRSGTMPLTPKAERFLADYQSFVDKTPNALERLVTVEEKTVALLHVTC